MLILSRGRGERIVIQSPGLSRPIVVEVQKIGGDKIRLAIDAPKWVAVDRMEVHKAKQTGARP